MALVTCNNLGPRFGRTGLDGFSSNSFCNRVSLKNASRGSKARKLWRSRTDFGAHHMFAENTRGFFLNRVADGVPQVLAMTTKAKDYSAPSHIFELVADDLLTLNKNLNSIFGPENCVYTSAADEIFDSGGKRMRPALVFLVSRATAEMVGLKGLTEEQRKLAEIIELIHTASLIHDDVIDECGMRRGKETIHRVYGTRVAVLAGDFMFSLSSVYLINLENRQLTKILGQAIHDVVNGEINQASNLFNCNVQLDEYLLKNYNKTASFIAAGTNAAAISSGVDAHISDQMHQYGKNLGQSFQLVDDILDFTESSEQLGKPVGSDLAQGNLTAPVIFALEKETQLRDIIQSKFCETGSLERAVDIVKNSGGINRARALARDFADQAFRNLSCLPRSSFRLALEEMVNFNLEKIK